MVTSEQIQVAATKIAETEKLAISSGAGVSKESGVPTFRDAQDGLWKRYDATQLASPEAFMHDPGLVWRWYMYRYDLISAVAPNPGHDALAQLEELVPEMVIITQNIDGLHEQAGSTDIIELHGNIRRSKCFDNCLGIPTLVEVTADQRQAEDPPECPHCAFGLVRPDVVWFGETLPTAALNRAFDVAASCDVMLVVGTSGLVQPAASLPVQAKRRQAYIIEVNPSPSMITPLADLFLEAPSGQILPRIVDAVREHLS